MIFKSLLQFNHSTEKQNFPTKIFMLSKKYDQGNLEQFSTCGYVIGSKCKCTLLYSLLLDQEAKSSSQRYVFSSQICNEEYGGCYCLAGYACPNCQVKDRRILHGQQCLPISVASNGTIVIPKNSKCTMVDICYSCLIIHYILIKKAI